MYYQTFTCEKAICQSPVEHSLLTHLFYKRWCVLSNSILFSRKRSKLIYIFRPIKYIYFTKINLKNLHQAVKGNVVLVFKIDFY